MKQSCRLSAVTEVPPVISSQRADLEGNIQCNTLSEFVIVADRALEGAAGFDLGIADERIILAEGKAIVWTDICLTVPSGCYGWITPRSGLAAKWFLNVGAGVIDRDY
uniref:Deoxyuridine 5'-triphosphate nucleotidohydrolase n=1 Tax=Erpetoichthys calabaricus TaxID=27687 RepID=A0A8C4XBY8_ERPCA